MEGGKEQRKGEFETPIFRQASWSSHPIWTKSWLWKAAFSNALIGRLCFNSYVSFGWFRPARYLSKWKHETLLHPAQNKLKSPDRKSSSAICQGESHAAGNKDPHQVESLQCEASKLIFGTLGMEGGKEQRKGEFETPIFKQASWHWKASRLTFSNFVDWKDPWKIEWDLTNGPLSKLLELLDTQVEGSVKRVLLEISWKRGCSNWLAYHTQFCDKQNLLGKSFLSQLHLFVITFGHT